jgi:CBS domain-containing protein
MKIADLMQRDVVTATPETSLKAVAALLVEKRISGLPVVLPDGSVAGVVSEADILRKEQALPLKVSGVLGRLLDAAYGDEKRFEARTAGEAMTTPAITVGPHADVTEAARLMVEKHVNRLPVVEGAALVGIVTRADLVRAFQRSDDAIEEEIRHDVLLKTLWIAPGTVDVAVEDGVVTLSGDVDETILSCVRRVPGVVSVAGS